MQYRTFGPGRERLSVLGFGASRVGSFRNATPPATQRETMTRALELGVSLFDTADIYAQGDSERELGRLLKGRRDSAFVVTKAGKTLSPAMRLLRPLKPMLRPLLAARRSDGTNLARRRQIEIGDKFHPAHLGVALDASLKRLGFAEVDGFLLHSLPAAVAADPAVAEAMAALKRMGKTRHIGVSCDDLASLRAALAMADITLLELPVDLLAAIESTAEGAEITSRHIGVIAREAIRLRADLAAPAAVAEAAANPRATSVVVGVSSPQRLDELVAALACAR